MLQSWEVCPCLLSRTSEMFESPAPWLVGLITQTLLVQGHGFSLTSIFLLWGGYPSWI